LKKGARKPQPNSCTESAASGRPRALAYRLYTTCERKGWTQEALSYNALIVAWPEIARRVAGTPEAEAQQALEV
jgi:adenine-specific DNA methylase